MATTRQKLLDRPAELAELAAKLYVLSSMSRLLIIMMLVDHPEGLYGMDFIPVLQLTQGTVSHHLRVLREAGLIVSEQVGVFVVNRISPEAAELGKQFPLIFTK